MNAKRRREVQLLQGFAATAKDTAPALAYACDSGAVALIAIDKWKHPAVAENLELKRKIKDLERQLQIASAG